MRTLIKQDPFLDFYEGKAWCHRGVWPCRWVACPDAGDPPFITAYRKHFTLDREEKIRVHVSADERYELFLDGQRIGRGSERGDRNNWFYETYDLKISRGDHLFVARVWSMGAKAPFAQMTFRPGFIFAPEGKFTDLLGTGIATWEAKKIGGMDFVDPSPAWGTGANLVIDGSRFPWGFEKGQGEGWSPVIPLHDGRDADTSNEIYPCHLMRPATLPAMMEQEANAGTVRFVSAPPSANTQPIAVNMSDHLAHEAEPWNLIASKTSITVPPNTKRRVIIDLNNYYCAYPEIITTGGKGSTIRVLWSESLFENVEKGIKGNRNDLEGKFFWGVGDTFKPDGGQKRRFETLWWQAGRYVELYVETANEPLTIDRFILRETRYPLEMQSGFQASDDRFNRVTPIALRGLQMCSHETSMACPYYEQLMYVGDTRLEVLVTYTVTRDDRLPRKALSTFDFSRIQSGLTQSRYPSRVRQVIPPFSLWWTSMVRDFALWRGDVDYVRTLMPGVRQVLDTYLGFTNEKGLIQAPNGWNFMDWVPTWNNGVPPEGEFGVNSLVNWQMVYALAQIAELEDWLGEPELAKRNRRMAGELAKRVIAAFWDKKRKLFADDLAKKHFSEHSQCIAILSGELDGKTQKILGESLLADKTLARTTIYFTHYLFETYQKLGKIDALFDRLQLWFDLDKLGFKTTFETPEPSRSDCHAWGAHPIYHYFASILGIRPAEFGFNRVIIRPQLGPLTWANGTLIHPKGEIKADFRMGKKTLEGQIVLPKGVSGLLVYKGKKQNLKSGKQKVSL